MEAKCKWTTYVTDSSKLWHPECAGGESIKIGKMPFEAGYCHCPYCGRPIVGVMKVKKDESPN